MNRRWLGIVMLRLLITGLLLALAVWAFSRQPVPPPDLGPPPDAALPLDFGPLVDLRDVDPTIGVELRYLRSDNFVGEPLYAVNRALLLPVTAERLARVQARLQSQGYGLKVWDAYRPVAVQRRLWEALPDPRFVADPAKGSNHSRGAAVDVTLVDLDGNDLELPSDFDDFERGRRDNPAMTAAARRHLAILTDAMVAEGFVPYVAEWWHFNEPGAAQYPVLDVPLEGR